jgi:hypothetical protein
VQLSWVQLSWVQLSWVQLSWALLSSWLPFPLVLAADRRGVQKAGLSFAP